MKIGLRGRLVVGSFIAVPFVTLALALMAQQVMVKNIRGTLDDGLYDRWQVLAGAIQANPSSPSDGYAAAQEVIQEHNFASLPPVLRIAGPSGHVAASMGNIPPSSIALLDGQLANPNNALGAFYNLQIRDVEALRVYTRPVYDLDTGERLAVLQLADSLGPVRTAEGTLWKAAASIGLGGSLLSFLVGVVVVRRSLAPLERILQRIKQVDSRDLAAGLLDEPRPPELQEFAVSLNTMWIRLDGAFKSQKMLVVNLSHDLRTPLTVLQGQVEVLLMQPNLSAEDRASMERMSRELSRLVRMTNNLLLNAQLEGEPIISLAEVRLRPLLEEVMADAYALADDHDLQMDVPKDLCVMGDYDLLKQLTINLVDNAIKYTPKGGTIVVGLRQEAASAVLEVADTGSGIAAEHLPRGLEPFYRADPARNSRAGGAGLGLAIVKRICDLHQGAVLVRSNPGEGTSVQVRLPLPVPVG